MCVFFFERPFQLWLLEHGKKLLQLSKMLSILIGCVTQCALLLKKNLFLKSEHKGQTWVCDLRFQWSFGKIHTFCLWGSLSEPVYTCCYLLEVNQTTRSPDSLLVRAPGSWSKSCEFESRQELWGEFSSPELTICADSHSVSVPLLCYYSGT